MAHLTDNMVNLFITLARLIEGEHSTDYGLVWKCRDCYMKFQSNSHFTLGINTDNHNMICYNIPRYYWDKCNFATTLEKLPLKDNTRPEDMVQRLQLLYPEFKKRWE